MDLLPKEIRIRGLPLWASGWNTVFTRRDNEEKRHGAPIYRLDPYILFGFLFTVRGAIIFRRDDGQWIMQNTFGDYHSFNPESQIIMSKTYGKTSGIGVDSNPAHTFVIPDFPTADTPDDSPIGFWNFNTLGSVYVHDNAKYSWWRHF